MHEVLTCKCTACGSKDGRRGIVLPALRMLDPGEQRPACAPLRVGHDREKDEYVEFWFQDNKAKDRRVLSLPSKRNGGEFGWGYMMRRSRGACMDANNQRLLFKIHLCPKWPCPSDHRKSNGEVDVSKWAGLVPWHLMPQEGTYDAVVVAEEGPAVAASNPAAAVAADEELAVVSEQAACAASDAAAAAAATEEHKAQEHLAVAASNAAQACTPEKQNEIAAPQEEPTKMTECAAADAAAAVAEAMIASRATSAQAEAAAAALRHPSPAPLRLRETAAPLCV